MWKVFAEAVLFRDYNEIIETDKRKKRRTVYFHAFQTYLSATMIYCEEKSIEGKIGFVFDSGSMSPMHGEGYFEGFKLLEEMPNRKQIDALLFQDDKLIMHCKPPTSSLMNCTNTPTVSKENHSKLSVGWNTQSQLGPESS